MTVRSRLLWFAIGAGVVVAGFGVLAAYDAFRLPDLNSADQGWRNAGPVAISRDWALLLQEQPAHPFLAEYNYRLHVFRRGKNEGFRERRVDLPMNTGGRTHLDVYAYLTAAGDVTLLELDDRHIEKTVLRLCEDVAEELCAASATRTLVGTFEGAEFPFQFIPGTLPVNHEPWTSIAGKQ